MIEHGSHDKLMAEDGLYAELFTLQARAYVEQPERLTLVDEEPPDDEPIERVYFGAP